MFGLKPLLGLEPMAPIRPQLLVSHANHSATETSICMYVCMYVLMYVCMYVYVSVCMLFSESMNITALVKPVLFRTGNGPMTHRVESALDQP